MILKQYYLACLAHASYLIGDEGSGTAVVVDPQRDVGQYLRDARESGLEVRHVFLTHFHADFVAGHLELRDRAGAAIHLGARAEAEYDFTPMGDGSVLQFGDVLLKVLETPGHTPEGISILVYDLDKNGDVPHAVLTGDTLFIGDVGRPDLMASVGMTSSELAGMLYDSLHQKLLPLPDETLLYPGHGAGSMCGKNLSTDTVSTIGIQRQYNYALQPMNKEEFTAIVTADQPDAPAYFSYDAMLNRQERPTLDKTLEQVVTPLFLDEILQRAGSGAQVLDVREPADFAGAHLAGSINVSLSGQFATWCGTVLRRDVPIVLIAEPGREHEASLRLGRIGYDHIAGFLEGGMQVLEPRTELVRRTERVTAATLAEQLDTPQPPVILDVRTPGERQQKAIAESLHIPLNHLSERTAEVPRDRRVVVHCAGGYRSSIAASLLERKGFMEISDLVGGIGAWEASHLPMVASGA